MSCFSNFNPETEDPLGGWVGSWAMMALIKKHEAFLRHYKPFKKISDDTLQSHCANLWRKALLARVCSENADPPTKIWKYIGEEKCEDKYSNTPNTPKLRGHWTCTYIQESYNATVTNWATSYLRLAIKTTSHLRHLKPWLLSKWADAVEVCTIGHVVRGKRVPKNRWGRVRCVPWSLNPLTFQHVVSKGSTFDSCKMSTNFSSLKGAFLNFACFFESFAKFAKNLPQKTETFHSLPFGDRQESTIALQSVRCFGTEGRPEISEIQNLGSFLKGWTSFSAISPIFSHDNFHSDFL